MLPEMIDNNNVEYVVFYDYDTQNLSNDNDVLMFDESENSLPETDYNIIKLYNILLGKSQLFFKHTIKILSACVV